MIYCKDEPRIMGELDEKLLSISQELILIEKDKLLENYIKFIYFLFSHK